tara:strand:+ start:6649 stop:9198 length:2550 start_codon:yes stop_codon:yes gene_type:complete
MIVSEPVKATNTTGLETTEGKIKATASAIKILSSSLYEDKKLAVIRELACNALDANSAVGKADTPIEIRLPTFFDRSFSVTDCGPGMSKETLQQVYPTYFESTKNNSSTDIGGFGLGSKSPFSLTDNFTVESVTEKGEETNILVYLDGGFPKITVTYHTLNSDKPSGTKVSVAIKEEDIDELNKVIGGKDLFKYWKVFPVVHTDDPFTEKSINDAKSRAESALSKSLYETSDGIKYYSEEGRFEGHLIISSHLNNDFSHIIYGNIEYKIPDNIRYYIDEEIEKDSINETMWSTNFKIVFPLSIPIELAPSRERIEDTPDNREYLLQTVKKVLVEKKKKETVSLKRDMLKILAYLKKDAGLTYQTVCKINKVIEYNHKLCDVLRHFTSYSDPKNLNYRKSLDTHILSERPDKKSLNSLPIFFREGNIGKIFLLLSALTNNKVNTLKEKYGINIVFDIYNFQKEGAFMLTPSIFAKKVDFCKLYNPGPNKKYIVNLNSTDFYDSHLFKLDIELIKGTYDVPVSSLTAAQKEKLARILSEPEFEGNRPAFTKDKIVCSNTLRDSCLAFLRYYYSDDSIGFKSQYTIDEIVEIINSYNIKIGGPKATANSVIGEYFDFSSRELEDTSAHSLLNNINKRPTKVKKQDFYDLKNQHIIVVSSKFSSYEVARLVASPLAKNICVLRVKQKSAIKTKEFQKFVNNSSNTFIQHDQNESGLPYFFSYEDSKNSREAVNSAILKGLYSLDKNIGMYCSLLLIATCVASKKDSLTTVNHIFKKLVGTPAYQKIKSNPYFKYVINFSFSSHSPITKHLIKNTDIELFKVLIDLYPAHLEVFDMGKLCKKFKQTLENIGENL